MFGKLFASITVKGSLYVIGVLLVALAASQLQSCSLRHERDAALTKVGSVTAAAAAAAKDAKTRADQAIGACQTRFEYEEAEKLSCQAENVRIADQSQAAIKKAQAARNEAERTLTGVLSRLEERTREPSCARALREAETYCDLGKY